MPVTVTFNYVSTHTVNNNGGQIAYVPAIPASDRLYVIYNNSTNRPIYVGTAGNVQARFAGRAQTMRELGFGNVELGPILIMVVQILVDGNPDPPGDNGLTAAGIDVEHLLTRTYVSNIGFQVRNVAKWGPFYNNLGTQLNWSLVNNAGIANFGGPFNFVLANGVSF